MNVGSFCRNDLGTENKDLLAPAGAYYSEEDLYWLSRLITLEDCRPPYHFIQQDKLRNGFRRSFTYRLFKRCCVKVFSCRDCCDGFRAFSISRSVKLSVPPFFIKSCIQQSFIRQLFSFEEQFIRQLLFSFKERKQFKLVLFRRLP